MIRTYKYRLRPNRRFVTSVEAWLEFCQALYNAALQERIGAWEQRRKRITFHDQQRQLTEMRAEDEGIRQIHRGVAVDVLLRLDKAMNGFFRRVKTGDRPGFPRFRSRSRYSSLTWPRARDDFKIKGDRLTLSKLGSVRMRLHRPIQGTLRTCTIIKQVDGWHVALGCEMAQPSSLPATGATIGVDVGLENFATLSTGERISNPRFFRIAERGLSKAQRRVSKKRKGGIGRQKAVRLFALRHLHVQRQRLNFAHQIANDLVRRFDRIVVEELDVRDMVRNRRFAKSIGDAGWSIFINVLTYKAENAGREIVKVNPAYTSQTGSGCGLRQKLNPSQRRFICGCGLNLHRDHNAAINILASASPIGRVATAAQRTMNH